ncbi:hypothetical protein LINPERHAP2_LOCUS19962 [Linum perenne]
MRKVKELNFAYMMKLAFLFFKSPNDLWVQVLQHKYFRDGANGLVPKNSSRVSPLWRAIERATLVMNMGFRWDFMMVIRRTSDRTDGQIQVKGLLIRSWETRRPLMLINLFLSRLLMLQF